MEKPMTDEVGSDDLEVEAGLASPAGRSNDAHDFLRPDGVGMGAGAVVDTCGGAGVGAVEADAAERGVGTVVVPSEEV
jgi:hypothetical protein